MNRQRIKLTISGHRRSGTALIVAIICLTLTTAMTASLVRLTLTSHRQVERQRWRLQSEWLAESGLARAAARLQADDAYIGETWNPQGIGPAGEDGTVTIEVEADPQEPTTRMIAVTADFPDDPTDRVRTTRRQTYRSVQQDMR